MFARRHPPPRTLLALDLETTGLDPRRDTVVAAGLLPIAGGSIRWGERFYSPIDDPRLSRPRDAGALGAHQILPAETRGTVPLAELLERLACGLVGEVVLLAHGAFVERGFVAAAARFLGKPLPRFPWLDTLDFLRALERHQVHLADRLPRPAPVPSVLSQARAFFALPAYPAHHALYDALGTAELYLLLSRRFPELHPRLRR